MNVSYACQKKQSVTSGAIESLYDFDLKYKTTKSDQFQKLRLRSVNDCNIMHRALKQLSELLPGKFRRLLKNQEKISKAVVKEFQAIVQEVNLSVDGENIAGLAFTEDRQLKLESEGLGQLNERFEVFEKLNTKNVNLVLKGTFKGENQISKGFTWTTNINELKEKPTKALGGVEISGVQVRGNTETKLGAIAGFEGVDFNAELRLCKNETFCFRTKGEAEVTYQGDFNTSGSVGVNYLFNERAQLGLDLTINNSEEYILEGVAANGYGSLVYLDAHKNPEGSVIEAGGRWDAKRVTVSAGVQKASDDFGDRLNGIVRIQLKK